MADMKWFATGAVLAIAVLHAGVARSQQTIDRVLAVVGGQVITLTDTQAALQFGLVETGPGQAGDPLRAVLDALISRQLILDEVNRFSAAEPDPAAVEKRLAAIRARFPSADAFNAACARTGTNSNTLRAIIRDNLRVEQYLKERFSGVVQPTEDDLQRYYTEHSAEFTRAGTSYETVKEAIREQLILARRQDVIAEWLTRLHRRTEVNDLYTPAARKQGAGHP
jgi:hypothetical protein